MRTINIGVSATQAVRAFQAAASNMGVRVRKGDFPEFFDVKQEQGGRFTVTFYRPHETRQIIEWFKNRKHKPNTVNSYGYHVFDVDKDTALLAKLTFGGSA